MPNGTVYVAYATSSNPVGAEFDGTGGIAYGGLVPVLNGNPNQIFGPEKNTAVEVGTKWELFDRHLLVTGALFQTTKDNAREAFNVTSAANATPNCPYPAGTTGSISCIIGGAAYYVRGIDLGVTGKITDKWSVFGGLTLMQSQVTKSNVPTANLPQPLLYTTNVGLPLANIAHQSFSLLTKYQLTDVWELGGQAVYRSKIYGGTLLAANQGTSIPNYWRFDTFAEAKINKNWKVEAVRQQHLRQALLRRVVSKCEPVRAGGAGSRRVPGAVGEILRGDVPSAGVTDADLRSGCAEQG